jgi:cation diffusion facilitator CzcD-associated flavoprotein CzcO
MAINSTIARNEKTVRPRRVAVIGAGVSGIVTAKWLRSSGLNVVIYERSKEAGGNW